MSATTWTDAQQQGPSDAAQEDRFGAARSVADQLAAVEPLVRGICRSRLGPVDGDDAAQRTLLVLWRKLADGAVPVGALPAYATVCARYETLPHAAGYRGRSAVPLGDTVEQTVADTTPSPAERARREVEIDRAEARVDQLLATLTPRQAEVLRATRLEGCDTDTAARELGITASSVRTAQARAMARLRELCGTRSPNPLASAVPEAQRRQAAWAERTAARVAERIAHPSPAQAEFAAEFLRRRLDGGLSQSQLGAALGYDGSYVSRVERGKTWPSRDFARRVDEVLATGGAFQDRHGRHSTDTAAGEGTAAGPRDQAIDHDEFDDVAVTEHVPDDSQAAAACAVAHTAVHAAVEHARTAEAGAGHLAAERADGHDEPARAAQLGRWHADDQETATTDSTTDASAEWALSA
jgi:RNA polymerase sigma factor (sigma-70 family)